MSTPYDVIVDSDWYDEACEAIRVVSTLRPVKCVECGITWPSHPDFLNHLTAIERHNEQIHRALVAPDPEMRLALRDALYDHDYTGADCRCGYTNWTRSHQADMVRAAVAEQAGVQ